jgi:hypothetical protein
MRNNESEKNVNEVPESMESYGIFRSGLRCLHSARILHIRDEWAEATIRNVDRRRAAGAQFYGAPQESKEDYLRHTLISQHALRLTPHDCDGGFWFAASKQQKWRNLGIIVWRRGDWSCRDP